LAFKDDLTNEVTAIFNDSWAERDGTVVPIDASLKLGNDAVRLNSGTVLYADLSDSTKLVDGYKNWFAAEVYKAFLRCAARIIRSEGGEITAYDGDRIMAIYLGDTPKTNAVRTGLKINWVCKNVITPAMQKKFPTNTYVLKHTVGIDASPLFVARAGIRGANDLVWIGRAANYAAKLCTLDHDYPTWITKVVYDSIMDTIKISNGTNIWEARAWTAQNNMPIYRSSYWWSL